MHGQWLRMPSPTASGELLCSRRRTRASKPRGLASAVLLAVAVMGGQAKSQSSADNAASPPAAPQATPPRSYQPALPGTEDDPDSSSPVYSDLTSADDLAADAHEDDPSAVLTAEQWLGRFINLHSAMDYAAAAEAALRLVEAAPDRAISHYNLACVMSKLNRFEAALAALNRAVDLGWRNTRHLSLDPDFDLLRGSPEFNRILERIRSHIAAERMESAPLRVDDELDVIVRDMNERVPTLLERYHVPGVSVAIVRNGRVNWQGTFGSMEASGPVSMPGSAVFRVRAPMHLMALVAAMQQQQAGCARLADILQQADELDRLTDARMSRGSNGRTADIAYPVELAPVSSHDRQPSRAGASRSSAVTRDSAGDVAFGLIRLSVETTSEQDFYSYCMRSILQPLDMAGTSFSPPSAGAESAAMLAAGHSALGTRFNAACAGEDRAAGGCLYTTAQDMGRLIEAMIAQSNGRGPLSLPEAASSTDCADETGDPLVVLASHMAKAVACRDVARQPGRGPNLRLGIRVDGTASGRRVSVFDRTHGQGCLLRWYPARQCGVAVMFNSATGADAAERIAHIALGGD